jgi:hypothetical protein
MLHIVRLAAHDEWIIQVARRSKAAVVLHAEAMASGALVDAVQQTLILRHDEPACTAVCVR